MKGKQVVMPLIFFFAARMCTKSPIPYGKCPMAQPVNRTDLCPNQCFLIMIRTALLSVALALTTTLSAQVGTIDPNFQPGSGFGTGFVQERVETIVQQADGKLLIGGWFTDYNGTPANRIVRINLDGSIDNSFNTGAGFDGFSSYVKDIAVQPNGKIVVVGNFLTFDGVTRHRIARLNADGSLDDSFDPLTGFDSDISTLALQPDGKIIVAGIFSNYDWLGNAIPYGGICRLNAGGSIDESFDPGTGFGSTSGQRRVNKIVLQPDGKILCAGQITSFNNEPRLMVARLNANGSLDSSFDPGENFTLFFGFYGEASALALLPDGDLMLGGNFGYTPAGNSGLVRLNSDGSHDPTFAANASVTAFTVQADGKVIAARSGPYFVRRYLADGSIDTGFEGVELNDWATDITVQFDGNVILGGWFDYNPNGIMRLIGDTPSVGIAEAEVASPLILFPNPTTDRFRLTVDAALLVAAPRLTVVTLDGRVVLERTITDATTVIPCADWSAGTYLVELTAGSLRELSRLVVR
jgi:uncharacterized delta-60 repeat protein